MKLRLPIPLLSALALSFSLLPSHEAATISWSGDADGNWDDTTKWSGGVLPGTSDQANIHKNATITINGEVEIATPHFSDATKTKVILGAADGNSKLIFSERLFFHRGNIIFGDGINPIHVTAKDLTNTDSYYNGEKGIVTINEKATLEAYRLVLGNWSGDTHTEITLRGSLLIRGNSLTVATNAPLVLGHWSATNANLLTVESGLLDVSDGLTLVGWSAGANLTIKGGVANFKKLQLHYNDNPEYDRVVNLEGGRMNIGSGGMTMSHTDKKLYFNLGAGTVGAFSDWSSGAAMTLTTKQTTFDTLDSKDNSTAHNITLTGVLSGAGGIIKDGEGSLKLGATNTYTGATTVKKGTLEVSGSIATTSGITLYNGSTITGAGLATYNKDITIINEGNAAPVSWTGSAANINNLKFTNSGGAVTIDGNLSLTGNLNITLDKSTHEMGPVIQLTGANTLSLASSSKIVIDAYNAALDQTVEGIVILNIINPSALSSILTTPVITWNRTDEKYTFDTSQFLSTGSVKWTSSVRANNLLTVAEASSTPFTATSENTYVGAKDPLVIFTETNTYTSFDGNTRLTDGYGTFVFQPQVAGTGALLVLGMEQGGQVVLTNNNNAQTRTEITDTTLVIDSTQGNSPITTPSTVGILGTGAVSIYGSSSTPGVLELKTGGTTAYGTYTIANSIKLNGNSGITQTGANSHSLTGDITVVSGSQGFIKNDSTSDLLIDTSITVDPSSSLNFTGDTGKILLSGSHTLSAPSLDIKGTEGVELTDGYKATVNQINLNDTSTLSLNNGSTLNLGAGGISQGSIINLSNSSIISSASSSIKTGINLDGASSITTNGNSNITKLEGGITGTGDLVKKGTGKLIISSNANPSTTGTIILEQGHLQLGQDTAKIMEDGKTNIPSAYTLKGDLDVKSGTLSGIVNAEDHDVHLGSGTILSLAIDSSDLTTRITNAKNITIDPGATLEVNAIGQGWTTGVDYIIISANNSLSGAEMKLSNSGHFAFVDTAISQTSKNVILTLSAKVPEISLNNRNEAAIFPTIADLVISALEGRYGDLSRELLSEMQYVSKMKVSELESYVSQTALSASSFYSALAGQVSNTTRHVQSVRNRITQLDPALFDQYQLTNNRNIWVEGYTNYADVDSTNYAPGYQLDAWGVHTGVTFSLSEKAYFGTGFGYISGETKTKGGYNKSEDDTFNIDLFGRYKEGNFSLSAVVSGGFSNVDFSRTASYQGDAKIANSKTDGSHVLGMIEAAYDLQLNDSGSSILQPLVNISAGYVKYDGFDESGLGNAGYHIDGQQVTVSTLGAGFRYIYTEQTPESYTPWRVEFRAMVTQDVGDTSYEVKANYLGARNHIMNLEGVPLERTAFVIGASGVIPLSTYTSLFGDVTGEFRDGQSSVSANIGLSFQF